MIDKNEVGKHEKQIPYVPADSADPRFSARKKKLRLYVYSRVGSSAHPDFAAKNRKKVRTICGESSISITSKKIRLFQHSRLLLSLLI